MKKLLMLTALAGLASVSAFASSCQSDVVAVLFNISSTTNGNLYNDTGFSCTVGNYTFSNFQLLPDAPADQGADIYLQITSASSTGLVFSTDLTTGQDVELGYEITGPSGGISSMVLGNNGASGSDITELICSGPIFVGDGGNGTTCGGSSALTSSFSASGGLQTSVSVGFSTTDWVEKDIDAGNTSGTSGISGFSQTVNASVPEPMTFSLMGAGLLGLGFLGRGRRRSQR